MLISNRETVSRNTLRFWRLPVLPPPPPFGVTIYLQFIQRSGRKYSSQQNHVDQDSSLFSPRKCSLFLDFFFRSIDSNKHCNCPAHKRWRNSTLGVHRRWSPTTVHHMGKRRDHIRGWQSGCGHNILEQWHHHTESSSCSGHFRWQARKVHLCRIQPGWENTAIVCNRR